MLGDQRIARSDAPRLADADAHAREEQLPEGSDQTAKCGEQAPRCDRKHDHARPALAVGVAGEGNREGRINRGECDPAHQPELRVAEAELGLDRNLEDADAVAMEEIERVGDEKEAKDEAAAPLGQPAQASPAISSTRRPTSSSSW